MKSRFGRPFFLSASLALLVAVVLGCATTGRPSGRHFDFFAPAVSDSDADPWYPKVAEWQVRASAEGSRLPASSQSLRVAERTGSLLPEMSAFRDDRRHELAREIHDFTIKLARRHYKWDPSGDHDPVFDHWPTVGELLANNGDDCDGLDLIAYQMLREFGFPPDQLYRGILRRDRDRANHMVTFWFETPDDPWVFDATGAVAVELHHLSELPGWTPTKIFNERVQYSVIEKTPGRSMAAGQ